MVFRVIVGYIVVPGTRAKSYRFNQYKCEWWCNFVYNSFNAYVSGITINYSTMTKNTIITSTLTHRGQQNQKQIQL